MRDVPAPPTTPHHTQTRRECAKAPPASHSRSLCSPVLRAAPCATRAMSWGSWRHPARSPVPRASPGASHATTWPQCSPARRDAPGASRATTCRSWRRPARSLTRRTSSRQRLPKRRTGERCRGAALGSIVRCVRLLPSRLACSLPRGAVASERMARLRRLLRAQLSRETQCAGV